MIFNQKSKSENKTTALKIKSKVEINSKEQIFKITLTGILLGLSVVLALPPIGEWPISFLGVILPLRVFDSLIIAFALPVIGLYYTLLIGIIEPWLHLLLDGDHPPIQIFFDNITNSIFIISFYFIYYYVFKLRDKSKNLKQDIAKKVGAGMILIPLNAIVASLGFTLTLVVLYFNPTLIPQDGKAEHIQNINSFTHYFKIFMVLVVIQILRYSFVFILFSLTQRKNAHIQRYFK